MESKAKRRRQRWMKEDSGGFDRKGGGKWRKANTVEKRKKQVGGSEKRKM